MKLFLVVGLTVASFGGGAKAQEPASSEVVAGDSVQLDESVPAVAMDGAGRALVVWESSHGDFIVRGRLLAEQGEGLSELLVLSDLTDDFRGRPFCAAAPFGSGVAAWSEADLPCSGGCVGIRTFTPLGVFTREVSVANEDPEHGGYLHGAAVGLDGASSLVWVKGIGSNHFTIRTRSFREDRSPVSLDVFVADARRTADTLVRADVATLASSDLALVWNTEGQDAEGNAVFARIISQDGSRLGGSFLVNDHQLGDQITPTVAADDEGRFVVAWDSVGQDGSGHGIYARVFGPDGTPLTGEIQVSSDADSSQYNPDVAMDPDGTFAVVFESICESTDSCEDSFLRAFRVDGTPLGPQVQVNEIGPLPQVTPSVALSASGLSVVAWDSLRVTNPATFSTSHDILARHFVLPCLPGPRTLCLGEQGRFLARAFFESHDGSRGYGRSLAWTRDTGALWFFDQENVELAVKVLDACAVDGTHWIYAAGLTDVRATLVVTDTWTGQTRALRGEQGDPFAPGRLVGEIGPCALERPPGIAAGAASSERRSLEEIAPSAESLLLGGRVRATARWRRAEGSWGAAQAVRLSDGAGVFWFFDPGNPELVVKLLDGCGVNGRRWLSAGGLTDLEVELRIEELATGATRTYRNQPGAPFSPILDTQALDDCP